jgi:molybdopterin-guanine dinucleotide biosynthesis protein A
MENAGKSVTGIILAGGKSSRMGFDKGMADFNGRSMVTWVIDTLQVVCTHIIIISNAEAYQQLGFPVYADIHKGSGPLGGIQTGLTYSTTEYNLIMACDMPYVKPELLVQLLAFADTYKIVVPYVDGQFEPLCGFYHKHTLPKMEELLQQNIRKMQQVIRQFPYKEIKIEGSNPASQMFANINTPKELLQHQRPGKAEE